MKIHEKMLKKKLEKGNKLKKTQAKEKLEKKLEKKNKVKK